VRSPRTENKAPLVPRPLSSCDWAPARFRLLAGGNRRRAAVRGSVPTGEPSRPSAAMKSARVADRHDPSDRLAAEYTHREVALGLAEGTQTPNAIDVDDPRSVALRDGLGLRYLPKRRGRPGLRLLVAVRRRTAAVHRGIRRAPVRDERSVAERPKALVLVTGLAHELPRRLLTRDEHMSKRTPRTTP
jgi:hypothetical protein